jgi:hypothetical protein
LAFEIAEVQALRSPAKAAAKILAFCFGLTFRSSAFFFFSFASASLLKVFEP